MPDSEELHKHSDSMDHTPLERLAGHAIAIIFVVGFAGAMHWLYTLIGGLYFTMLVSFAIWYVCTWFEWELNGGGIGYKYPGWTKSFFSLYHTLRCFSYEYCLTYAGYYLRDSEDEEWKQERMDHADMLYESRWWSLITPVILLVLPNTVAFYHNFM